MNVLVINITLVELNNIRVVYLLQNGEFLFQKSNILFDISAQNALDSVFDIWLLNSVSKSNSTKVATTHQLLKFVDLTHISVRIVVFDIFKRLLPRT